MNGCFETHSRINCVFQLAESKDMLVLSKTVYSKKFCVWPTRPSQRLKLSVLHSGIEQ